MKSTVNVVYVWYLLFIQKKRVQSESSTTILLSRGKVEFKLLMTTQFDENSDCVQSKFIDDARR